MEKYTKPALTFEQQIELLRNRGLQITDEARAIRHLSNISYYRLSAYMLPFKEYDDKGCVVNAFKSGTTWDDVYNLYRFDRKFRLLIFDAIERIEIALRTQIIYQLSHKYGSHWQDNAAIFKLKHYRDKNGEQQTYCLYNKLQKHIADLLQANNRVDFIEHYLNKYDDPKNPPSWMCMELMYFNELSKICTNLTNRRDITDIAKFFDVPSDKVFCSWLHAINYIRNICAHHARLWNIRLSIQPEKFYYKGTGKIWLTDAEVNVVQSSKVYYFMCVILYLLETVNPNSKFKKHFFELLEKYPNVDVGYMGFPKEWKEHPLWK